jgi:hypothetical protein
VNQYFQQVSETYDHYSKKIRPGPAFQTPWVYLKWYLIYPETLSIDEHEVFEAQSHLREELALKSIELNDETGFVVHHRTAEWMILYVCTWRGNNEIWETLYHKRISTDSTFKKHARTDTSATFCVWVMAAVCHEQKAWSRFLQSQRNTEDQQVYLSDQLSDLVW